MLFNNSQRPTPSHNVSESNTQETFLFSRYSKKNLVYIDV